MITTLEGALDLCKKYDVDISVNPDTVVTGNGNIYIDGNIDPKDNSERFVVKQEVIKAVITEVIEKPKNIKK